MCISQKERNLLFVLPRQIHEQAADYKDTNDWDNDKGEETEYLPNLNAPTPLDKLLTDENFKLIQDILDELQEYEIEKWGYVQVFELFPDILKDIKYYMKSVEWQNWQRMQKYWSLTLTDHSSVVSSQKQECEHNMKSF